MATQRETPYPNFNFVVEIGGGPEIGFAEVEIPAAEIAVIEYREGGRTNAVRRLPGRVRYGNVVLRRGIDGGLDLWRWFKEVRDGNLARRDVTITLLDEKREPVQRWLIRDAWPTKYDPSDLNAKGNEVVIETLELACEGIEVE